MPEEQRLSKINIQRTEGPSSDCSVLHTLSSFEEADECLLKMSDTAPKDIAYHTVNFGVFFTNGDSYEGSYNLRHSTAQHEEGTTIDLKKRILDHLAFLACHLRPRSMSDKNWEYHQTCHLPNRQEYHSYIEKIQAA